MNTKKKALGVLILVAIAVVAAGGLYLAFNVKTIKVSSDLKCRVTFGKMADDEARRVLAVADRELMRARKYPFARDAYNAVATYHTGQYRDDAFLGVARTYLAEGKRADAYPWLARVAREYPRGSAVETRAFDGAVTGELGALLARPPLDYGWAVKYLDLLARAGSPDAAAWRQRFKDIIETPFTVDASFSHAKELNYVVRETATRDARASALFYAREKVPTELCAAVKKRVVFGAYLPDDKLLAAVENRVVYVDRVEKVGKPGEDENKTAKAEMDKSREEKGLGALPEEWANAFLAAEEDTGWVASASVVGELKNVTIAELLTFAGVDPTTGAPLKK